LQLCPEQRPTGADVLRGPKGYAYRICRKGGENPWNLRLPTDVSEFSFDEQRALVIHSIANGNKDATPSNFLHASGNLQKALKIFQEREHLYSTWLVRWPKDLPNVDKLSFEMHDQRAKWFTERQNDTDVLIDLCKRCIDFTEKDSELVYFARPSLDVIEWWDEFEKQWHYCRSDIKDSAQSQFWVNELSASGQITDSTATCILVTEDSALYIKAFSTPSKYDKQCSCQVV